MEIFFLIWHILQLTKNYRPLKGTLTVDTNLFYLFTDKIQWMCSMLSAIYFSDEDEELLNFNSKFKV